MRIVALLATLVLVAAGCGGGGDDVAPLPEGRALATKHSLTPAVQLFAEPMVARVDVLVDGELLDPERIRIVGFFEPYEQEGETQVARRDQGRYTQLRYEFVLRCLVYECLAGSDESGEPTRPPTFGTGATSAQPAGAVEDRKAFQLKAARVLYDDPEGGTRRLRNLAWPEAVSVSRLNLNARDNTSFGFPFKGSVTPLPEATYRVPPPALGVGLLAGALALIAFPAGLVVRSFRRKPELLAEEETALPPLERALRLVEWARERGPQERREALEVLAGELDQDRAPLADEARGLAWSRAAPAPEALADIAQRVRDDDDTSA